MQKLILTACAIAFLGGLITGKSVLAQDNTNNVYWAGKPIQCGPTDYALNQAMEGDLKPLWAGYGWSNSVNYDEPLPVLIHLHMDPESQRWVVMETGAPGTETCFKCCALQMFWNTILNYILIKALLADIGAVETAECWQEHCIVILFLC